MLTFTVRGTPAPQGSKSFKGIHGGHAVLAESSKKVKPWRMDVKAVAEAMHAQHGTLDGPLRVTMVFTVQKPKSAPKTRRTWPDKKPDLSKLVRSTEDAITDAGLWADDARVVEYARLAKVFPGEDPMALSSPGVWVSIEQVNAAAQQLELKPVTIPAGALRSDQAAVVDFSNGTWKPAP